MEASSDFPDGTYGLACTCHGAPTNSGHKVVVDHGHFSGVTLDGCALQGSVLVPCAVTGEPFDALQEQAIDAAHAEPAHDCWDHPVPYVSDGPLGHGWECGVCGNFLQAG